MCGFAGFIQQGIQRQTGEEILSDMAAAIEHRGPDGHGLWFDENTGVGFSHRRLAVQDLSHQGQQPMSSACGRYVLVYNGEVYNFKSINAKLEKNELAPIWRGHSDTEVILAAINAWGVEEALKYMVGMFAFALWDKKKRVITLARDRLGEKPLYYGWQGKTFLFASELKAFEKHPEFQGIVNRDVLSLFLRHSYIPTPYSIYKGINKLESGAYLQINLRDEARYDSIPIQYWTVKHVAEDGVLAPFVGTDSEAVEALDLLLQKTIRNKMLADVPLGAFLSGGIDSSMIVALMQSVSNASVRTFSIGFHEKTYNEATHAKAVANYLKTDHTELYVTPEQAMAVIPQLAVMYDEPFADSSQIPTFLVSEMTRKYVTVALSGDGGDELFGGYNRYFMGRSIWNKIGWMPEMLRRYAANLLSFPSPKTWDRLYDVVEPILPHKLQYRMVGDRLHKLASILAVSSPEQMYRRLVSQWANPEVLLSDCVEPATVLTDKKQWAEVGDFTQLMMFLDTVTYLSDDILTKVDRAAMSVSLETRVPFLDHRIVEFAWRLPLSMKIRNGQGKWLLRQVLNKYIPESMINRPKMGFGVPIDSWLRKPLQAWAEELLDEKRLREEGFFNPALIRKMWGEHLSGRYNWQYQLWPVLMFQAWNERWK